MYDTHFFLKIFTRILWKIQTERLSLGRVHTKSTPWNDCDITHVRYSWRISRRKMFSFENNFEYDGKKKRHAYRILLWQWIIRKLRIKSIGNIDNINNRFFLYTNNVHTASLWQNEFPFIAFDLFRKLYLSYKRPRLLRHHTFRNCLQLFKIQLNNIRSRHRFPAMDLRKTAEPLSLSRFRTDYRAHSTKKIII